MGKRGPAPKPTALKVLHGTYRADRAAPAEPTPEIEAPTCPSWLNREAKREWRRIVKHLEELGLVSQLDRSALAAYCHAYGEWWEMERLIQRYGHTQVTDKGYVAQRPEVAIRNAALQRMKQYGSLFGLSPSDRTKVNAQPKEERDPDEDFLMQGGRKRA